MSDGRARLDALPRVAEERLTPADLDMRLDGLSHPLVMRGIAAHWPLVEAGRRSAERARDYLAAHGRPRAFPANFGNAGAGSRLFYDDGPAMNFTMANRPLPDILAAMAAAGAADDAPFVYCSSLDLDHFFDGLAQANRLPLGDRHPIESIWIGSATRIAAHNDVPDNLAVCAVGARRFTLFPPETLPDLYPGPLDHSPAGRPVSMVDFHAPDFARFPRFANALEAGLVADLEPGDAIFVPSLWWHHVEANAPFNVLVNYWWSRAPAFLGSAEDALLHAILAVRDLPVADKARWKALFEHYVFADDDRANFHLPVAMKGILAPLTAQTAGQIRARLLRSLSR